MFVNFTEEARKILMLAKKEMYELKHEYIGTEHVLLAIMCIPNKVRKKLEEKGLTYKKIKDEIVDALGIGEESKDLFINQSVFTGDSAPIEKKTILEEEAKEIFDIENICLM